MVVLNTIEYILWVCEDCHITQRMPIRTQDDITQAIYNGWPLCPDCACEMSPVREEQSNEEYAREVSDS